METDVLIKTIIIAIIGYFSIRCIYACYKILLNENKRLKGANKSNYYTTTNTLGIETKYEYKV